MLPEWGGGLPKWGDETGVMGAAGPFVDGTPLAV